MRNITHFSHVRFMASQICLLVILAGCQLHGIELKPDPSVEGGKSYHQAEKSKRKVADRDAESSAQKADIKYWWERFDTPKLDSLVDEALSDNLDIAAAKARLREARALRRQTGSQLWPQIDIESESRDSRRDGAAQEGVSEIGAALDWEIDVFGRIDAQTQADRLEAKARKAALDTARLRISSEVVRTYFQAVAQARQIDLLKRQVESDREFLQLTQRRFDQGVANKVDVLQTKTQLAETRSQIPQERAELGVLERRLDILLGKAPDGESRIGKDDTFITMADLPPLGVPSDLLLERPDLRAARHELAAADAEIAAAIARRLPQFTLDGSYLLADGPGFAGPVASISAMVVQPLVDWGQRRAAVTGNKALYGQRLAEFTQEYIAAIAEVENALERERRQRTFLNRTRERRDVLNETLAQTRARYQQGLTDYLPVLDAVEELQVVERELVRARRDLIEHRIDLHRALGGNVAPGTAETDTHKPEKGK